MLLARLVVVVSEPGGLQWGQVMVDLRGQCVCDLVFAACRHARPAVGNHEPPGLVRMRNDVDDLELAVSADAFGTLAQHLGCVHLARSERIGVDQIQRDLANVALVGRHGLGCLGRLCVIRGIGLECRQRRLACKR